VAHDDILGLLGALVDKSLVVVELEAQTLRYRFLEPVHQYALQHLSHSGELEAIRLKHADYCLQLVQQMDPELSGPLQIDWLNHLEAEHSNIRVALQWLSRTSDPNWRGLRLASRLWRFWWIRSYFEEGRAHLRGLLDAAGQAAPPLVRAAAFHALGELSFRHGDIAAAESALNTARALLPTGGDSLEQAVVLRSLGRLALDRGDHEQALALLEEDLRIERKLNHRGGQPWALTYLGWLAIFDARLAEARELLTEALALSTELGDREGIGRMSFSLGHLTLDEGNVDAARTHFADALSVFLELDYKYGVAYALEGLADASAARGAAGRALTLASAAASLRQSTGAAAATAFQARHRRWLDVARASLPSRAAARTWEAGRDLDPAAFVALLTGR
jgi:tetratricopeptide (TPR) repeat protein